MALAVGCGESPTESSESADAGPTLTVGFIGAGQGSVTSDPSGIDCAAADGTCSATFPRGTQVTLTATPDSGHTFVGWSGACSGANGDCAVTLDADRSVTAEFDEPDAPTPPPPGSFPWQQQATDVEGPLSEVQFLDASTGWAVRRNRQGHRLTLFRTSDGGATWSADEITDDETTDMGHFLAVLDPETGFTGGEACTLLSTEDAGATWDRRRLCDSTRWLLSIHAIDADRIWVGGGGGLLFRTEDGGASWTRVTVAELDFPVNGIAFASPDVGLLVEAEQIFRTEDGGATWEHQASPQSPLNDVAFADATTAVAVGQSGAIIRSEDGGATWSVVETDATIDLLAVDFGADGFGVATGETGIILVSVDAGATWESEGTPVESFLEGAWVLDADHAWAVGHEGTILFRASE